MKSDKKVIGFSREQAKEILNKLLQGIYVLPWDKARLYTYLDLNPQEHMMKIQLAQYMRDNDIGS